MTEEQNLEAPTSEDEKLYSLPKEMGLLLGLATSDDMTVASITVGWLVRQVFEANSKFDFNTMTTKIDPAFQRRLDAHIEWMESFKSDPIQERRDNLITAINMRQSDG